MLFVKSEELKEGMKLARPIYNKDGVLLYDRASKITKQGVASIIHFKLIGIFILEAAEPVPPMTQDDIDFERFQTMMVFAIKEELEGIVEYEEVHKIQKIAADIIRNYGRRNEKINFVQNLRSSEDYLFKNSLNVAILCALVTRTLNVKLDRQVDTVISGLLYDIADMLLAKKDILRGCDEEEIAKKRDLSRRGSFIFMEKLFKSKISIKNITMECYKGFKELDNRENSLSMMSLESKILMVAREYDSMTAMHMDAKPQSEVVAIKHLLANDRKFDKIVVNALILSIEILVPGSCVELNNKEKGLVLVANTDNVLEPMILIFRTNKILDLSNPVVKKKLYVLDIMKTLDNRHVIDKKALKEYGY